MPDNNDEISLKEFIIKLRGLFAYLYSKRLLIIVVTLAGGILGVAYAIISKPRYTGKLNFVLVGSSNTGNLASLAGQFGIDLSNSSGDDVFQGDNIVELLKSQKIVRRSIFTMLPDSSDLLINLLARESGMMKKWQQNEYVKQHLPFSINQIGVDLVQDSLFRELYVLVTEKYLTVEKTDKKLSFYSVSTLSKSDKISAYLTTNLVKEAALFYIETKTKVAKDNLGMLQREADSIRRKLGGSISSAASATDETFNLNAALQINRASFQNSQFQIQVLATAYGEVVKNLEIAKITLQKETPLFQIIDAPSFPLKEEKKSKLLFLFAGGFVAAFLMTCWLITKRIYLKIMSHV